MITKDKESRALDTLAVVEELSKLTNENQKPKDFMNSKLCVELVRKIEFLINSIKS